MTTAELETITIQHHGGDREVENDRSGVRVARGHPRHLPRDRLRNQEGLPTLPRCSTTYSTTAVHRLRVHGTVADPHERLGGHRDDERADGTPVDQREPLSSPPLLPSSPDGLSST